MLPSCNGLIEVDSGGGERKSSCDCDAVSTPSYLEARLVAVVETVVEHIVASGEFDGREVVVFALSSEEVARRNAAMFSHLESVMKGWPSAELDAVGASLANGSVGDRFSRRSTPEWEPAVWASIFRPQFSGPRRARACVLLARDWGDGMRLWKVMVYEVEASDSGDWSVLAAVVRAHP